MQIDQKENIDIPPQHQEHQPGHQYEMEPQPQSDSQRQSLSGEGKLAGKTAIITGGDSGIGRAVAVAFAAEGARVVIAYLNEGKDAEKTAELVKKERGEILLIPGDITNKEHCKSIVEKTIEKFHCVDILVNNAGVQFPQKEVEAISEEQLLKTFQTNIFAQFYLTQSALPHMREGSCIINTTSVTAYKGSPHLIDYSATKGAIVSFTRSLSLSLAGRGIRVNGVAPGPIWTPLIPATFPEEKVDKFGKNVPMKRPGEPKEAASCFLFLASEDASYISGQILHPNGGEVVNG